MKQPNRNHRGQGKQAEQVEKRIEAAEMIV
jgi:hypothetical protein